MELFILVLTLKTGNLCLSHFMLNIFPHYFFFRPAPKNEDEMMVAIFEFIDRIFAIVRPRRLLYMAIDGVVS